MPKYMWRVNYSPDGAAGLVEQGGSVRRAAITEMVHSVGGTVEAFYFAFGDDDLIVIGDVPNEIAAAALAVRTAASGAAVSQTVPLLTAEQIDEAVALDVQYRPPGD
ncbi:GYD domain-containing protein [Hoyosella rhizosphaerae]|uniref:GYD domain-containing protein n=1 Tax=Hoyosella rhizosphaerae TaxID=1755582 RepID=A0A916TZZ9_9ACTN|nr:GYD domain-containing protein [Hoyosella rhizosphaerae]MBN4927119.1 GYD domain-containing protein [Hoyosella rhizosphaerae]GGC53843.1 hypothetical protein GCM10011410_02770 [Hoyosella rhizosphaerae]